jgi:hypothetical protein
MTMVDDGTRILLARVRAAELNTYAAEPLHAARICFATGGISSATEGMNA